MDSIDVASVRVLVVEDDAATAAMLRSVLELEGARVRVLHEPAAAEQAVAEFGPDLVVLDVMMPGRDGREVATALRGEDPSVGPGIILLSALSADEDVWEGWQAGADSYLTKPVSPDALIAECDRVLQARTGTVIDLADDQPPAEVDQDPAGDTAGGGRQQVVDL